MAEGKYRKSEVAYTDDHGTSSEQCSKCVYFMLPTGCRLVMGRIDPNGWCNKFERAGFGKLARAA